MFHRREREAPDAETLMRSRYSAFAMKQADYLWDTLSADHPDRLQPRDAFLRHLREMLSTHRFMGLQVLESQAPDESGVARVLFRARVFRDGRDLSFTERSEFVFDGTGWRYCRGEPLT